MKRIVTAFLCTCFLFILSSIALSTDIPDTSNIPEPLEQWKSWVLHGEEMHFCPASYNDEDDMRCMWPSRLELRIYDSGGSFCQRWLTFMDGWAMLPGGKGKWPRGVTVDGKDVPVIVRDNHPCVRLERGAHVVKGNFVWHELPETLFIPPSIGLVSLYVNGREVSSPLMDVSGKLYLKKRAKKAEPENRVKIRVFRLIDDTIPLRVITLIKLDVSGTPREIKVLGALLEDFIPLSIKSPLPAGIGVERELLIQARPGHWEVRVEARSQGRVKTISMGHTPYGDEIWSFKAHNRLRMVQVKGVPSIDPSRTAMPGSWKDLPAFIVRSGSQIFLKETRRGEPDPGPNILTLDSTWWLDFDGRGFTVQDRIRGTMNRNWYLAVNRPFFLGRVSVDGKDQLITEHNNRPGVEIRNGNVDLMAVSRYEASLTRIPVTGWDHDFHQVSSTLYLPPGWRLLWAKGADYMRGKDLYNSWTLFDLFLVMIVSLSVYRLWGMGWGIFSLITLVLTYMEPGAPHLAWLSLLVPVALLRVLPLGRLRRLTKIWAILSVVYLVIIALPFMFNQIRWGLFPQLEPLHAPKSGHAYHSGRLAYDMVEGIGRPTNKMSLAMKGRTKSSIPLSRSSFLGSKLKPEGQDHRDLDQYDPDTLIQTGPGVPEWKWHACHMVWNGTVARGQYVRLFLLPPSVNLVLSFVRVILVTLLIVKMAGFLYRKLPIHSARFFIFVLSLGLLYSQAGMAGTVSSAFPPEDMLKELKHRLLERPDCFPHCADSPAMEVNVGPHNIRLIFYVHGAIDTAVPLPGSLKTWTPARVMLDNHTAKGLMRDRDGYLWIFIPKGVHTVELEGPPPNQDSFRLPLPMRPEAVISKGHGWLIHGIGKNGVVRGGLWFKREGVRSEQGKDQEVLKNARQEIPPFLHVKRVISLGLDWHVTTTVTRETPLGVPLVVSIPLVPGEAVTTSGIDVKDGKVYISMGAKKREFSWESTLDRQTRITLVAPKDEPWTETWELYIGPVWHCTFEGIPVIAHKDSSGRLRPVWKPWPGERVTLDITKPRPVPGQYLTVDHVDLNIIPGQRLDSMKMAIKLRTSKGSEYRVALPPGAKVQTVMVNGKAQPLTMKKANLLLLLDQGPSTVDIKWVQKSGSMLFEKSPKVSVGKNATNIDIRFNMPENRWILWTKGPVMGPAVLFWIYLILVFTGALILGNIPLVHLRTWEWMLLGIGLSQLHPLCAVVVVGWFFALGLREKGVYPERPFLFDLTQVALFLLTVATFGVMYAAVQQGLLGIPDMQIAGNGSHGYLLHWTQDRAGKILPRPWVISVPLFIYRAVMLLWSLWLAHSLISWIGWAFESYSRDGLWKPLNLFRFKRRVKNE